MKKRALSWLLALTMLLTLAPQTLPVWASATGEKSNTATQTESKLSANTYSALGLSRNVADSEKPKDQPYGKAEVGNTIATNVINELYVNFNGSIHYGWSILDNIPMEYRDDCEDNWTNSRNFYGAMGYWRPNQQTVNYGSGSSSNGALFAENGSKTGGVHNDHLGKSINSANKHLTYQYSKSEAFSPNTGKDNYVAEMTIDSGSQVYLYIYQVEGGNKRYVRSTKVCDASESGGGANDKANIIYNWEYDAMYDIAAGDMDGDGYDEIAVYAQNCVYVYSFEDGTLSELIKKETVKPEGVNEGGGKYKKLKTAVVTLAFGDLNADDKDELVIAENIGYGATNIATGKVGIYRLETNESTKKNTLVKAMKDDISLAIPGSSGIFNTAPMVRYANVATGDIDGDYQDELIIAGYVSAKMNNAKCNRGDIAYMIVKGNSDNQFKHSDWNAVDTTNNRIDLLDRVVDNENQLIPPVALTCAATQGVGHSEQLFLGGWLYSVGLSADMSVKLSPLTRISTNREYKKDNGSKANKEEIFVVNVVAGNFNGNRNGQEQIVYAFGMKHDGSDRYWYDIGYINKKDPGSTDADKSSGYWYGQEQVMNFESSYNRDSNKRRASLYLSLAAVDCDNDSTLMRYKGQTVTWTKPEVLTVLQSAPYFQDLEDTRGYLDQGQTGYGKGSSSSSSAIAGTSLKVGTYVSFEQDFSVFGVKVASIEAEAQSTHEFEYEFQSTKEKSIEVRYSGSAGDDYAVVYAVPYMEYQYETWVPGYTLQGGNYVKYLNTYLSQKLGKAESAITEEEREKAAKELGVTQNTTVEGSWQPSSVMVPMKPATVLITVDDYDAIAEQTEGLEPIRGNILNSTPGEPATYDKINSRGNFNKIGDQQRVTTAEGGNVSLEATTIDTTAHTFAYNYEFEAKAGAGAGGVTVGVLAGLGTTAGGGISSSQSNSYSATVDNLPKDASKYGFSWQFGYREAKLNNNDVLVLEYQLDDVAQLPSMPKNLRVDSVTSNSVTLKWDKVTGAGAYKIYQRTSDNRIRLIATVPGTAESYTDTNVNPNNTYTYCVQNVSQVGGESIYSTDVRAITLTDANGNFVIKQQPKDLTTYVGGTDQTTVEAEYLKNGQPQNLNYYWDRYNTETKKWEDYSQGSPTLSVSVTEDTVDGTKYRCQVYYDSNLYIYTDPVTLTIGKANSATTLTSDNASPTVNASYVKTEKKKTGVEDDVPVKVTIENKTYTKYTKGDVEVYLDEDGNYYSISGNTATQLTKQTEPSALTYNTGSDSDTITVNFIPYGSLTKDNGYSKATDPITYTYKDEDENQITYTADEKYSTGITDLTAYKCSVPKTATEEAYDFWFLVIGDDQYAADLETKTTVTVGDKHIPIDELTLATEQKETETVEETYKEGEKVTLTATPSDPSQPGLKLSGKVVFKIVNSIGDGSKTVDATIGDNGTATAEWIPTAAGVYTITAAYEGNEKYMGSVSSQTITINVVVPEQKTLMIDSPNSMTYGDAAIELKTTLLKGATTDDPTSVATSLSNDVTYSVKNADGTEVSTGSTFAPTAAGTYTVTATYTIGSETLTATKSIVVNKRTVTIVPKVEGTGTTKTATYSLANCMTSDESLFTNKIQVTCAGTAPNAVAGEYPYTVTYTPGENEAAINSKYIVVIDTMHPYVLKDDMVTVTDKTSSNNGTVTLRYRSSSTDSYVDVYGDSVPKNAEVIAVASPKAGYRVKQWKVDGKPVTITGQGGTLNTAQTITVAQSATKNYTVEAEFELVYHTLSFEVTNGTSQTGTVTAKYLKDSVENGMFGNGKEVSYFDRVRLTANVDAGQSIKEWQITRNNGTPETLKIDNEVYTGNSYVLSSITADTEVTVITENQTDCTVKVHLVDKNGDPLTGGQVLFNGATQEANPQGTFTYSGHKNDDLTVALTLPSGLVVDEWLRKDDETNTSSALQIGSFTNNKTTWHVVNLPDSLDLIVKCSTPNSYMITTSTTVQGGTEGDNGGTIEVYQIGTTGQVDTVLQGSDLLVKVNPVNGYQLLDVTCNDISQMSQMGSGNEFRINGVNENIIIVATFVKKPVVMITSVENGTVEVKGTVNGVANTTIHSGNYVDYNTKLAITVKPNKGHEVTALKNGDNTFVLGGTTTDDKMAETSELTGNVTLTPTFEEIPHKTVTISVVDKNNETDGGIDGSVTASVTRKGMTTYAEYKTANSTTSTQTLNVYRDSVVTLSAQAENGYVAKWIYDGQETLTPPTLDFSASATLKDHDVKVRFDPIGKAITFTKDGDGDHASGITGSFAADNGSTKEFTSGNIPNISGTLTLTVTPDAGYEVEGWYVDGTKQENSAGEPTFAYPVTHDVGAVIQVKIIRSSYKVEFSAENGSITASPTIPADKMVLGDTPVTFTASPAQPTGYTFVGWTINGKTPDEYSDATLNNSTLTVTIKEAVTVQAAYTQDTTRHTVTYGVSGNDLGTLSLNTRLGESPATVANGTTVTFTATPKEGNYVEGWYSDAACTTKISGTGEETSYSVAVYQNTSVYVKFAEKPTYTITLTKNGSGKVFASVNGAVETEVSDSLSVKYHDSVVLRAEAGANDYFAGWQDNTTGNYTIADVTGDTSVTATFAPMQNVYLNAYSTDTTKGTLTATGSVSGSIQTNAGGNGVQVAGGQKITLTANPASGQMVKEWKINGQKVEGNLSNTLVIDSIKASTEVAVEFEEYVGYLIPTTPTPAKGYTVTTVERIPDDTPNNAEIRKGGTVTFMVVPDDGKVFTKLEIGTVNCLTTPSTGNVTAVREGNGYRITVSNVSEAFTLTAQATEFQVISNQLTDETKKPELRKYISSSVSRSNIQYLDITLQMKNSSGKWVNIVNPEDFPKGGVYVTISYPNGTDKQDTFYISHMLTVDMNGKNAGEVEEITPITKGENGISFHVTSLSPFAIGWVKYVAPTPGGGGGGGGGAVSTYTLTFDTNGGSAIDKITKDSGTTIDLAAYKPTRAGYTFAGWFSDKALTKAVTSVKLTANTTVYAKWTQNGGTAQNPFVDVKEGAYYYDAVLWAVEQKITSGTSATTFSPDASCTRAQMVTFLWRAAGSPKVENGKNPFTDVQADAYYYDAVLWAVEKGVTSGTSATTFSPDATVTRGQTVTFLYRNAGSPEVSGTMPFTDVEADAYYAKAVQWAVQQKITTGTSETTFSPMSDCTRGQIVTFLYRAK